MYITIIRHIIQKAADCFVSYPTEDDMKYFELLFIPIILTGPTTMYFAYGAMADEKNRLESIGYVCRAGREASGPSHSRDRMYLCSDGEKEVTVGIWGKPVNMKYKIDS